MTTIRVIPADLLKNSYNIIRITDDLNKAASAVLDAANSAPSYNGQFGPKVKAIGISAQSSGARKSEALQENGKNLAVRAERFQIADTGAGFSDMQQKLLSILISAGKIAQSGLDLINWLSNNHVNESGSDFFISPLGKLFDTWLNLKYEGNFFPIKDYIKKGQYKQWSQILENDAWEWEFLDIFKWKKSTVSQQTQSRGKRQYTRKPTEKGGGWQFLDDEEKTGWQNFREKFLKFDIPIFEASGSLGSMEGKTSNSKWSVDALKANASGKITLGGEDWFGGEISGDVSLASGKYSRTLGKNGYLDLQADFMKASGKVSFSATEGFEASAGFSILEVSGKTGINVGNHRIGIEATVRAGQKWGVSVSKKGKFKVQLGCFDIGLDIGKKFSLF